MTTMLDKPSEVFIPARVELQPTGLDRLFSPRSVAVLGAGATPRTVPFDIFYNILKGGFRGELYPVAPGKSSICDVPAYRYLLDISDEVDLAVIVFPANAVERAIAQCAQKGVKAAIIISAGFREAGAAGAEREQRVARMCRESGIALVGPNCLGLINTDLLVRLNATFARQMPEVGRIGFLSQSGALCTAVLDYARGKHIGFSKFISFGNKAGVSEIDLLKYLHADEQTDVILMYLEEVSNGRALVDAARTITRGQDAKPIFAIKAGRTAEGAGAAASHTGSLAGEDAVCEDAFRGAGIVRVGTIEEMFNAAILYANQPMPAGDRLAIVTNAGGPGVMATDAAVQVGLSMARFGTQTSARLKAALPPSANLHNPVDVIGDARAERYDAALDAVLGDPGVDQVLVILTPQSMTDIDAIAQCVCRVANSSTKPLACSFMGAADVGPGVQMLQQARIPHYILPEHACRAMADVQRVRTWRERPSGVTPQIDVDRQLVESIIESAPPGYLREDQALAILAAYGLPVPAFKLCCSPSEAVEFAAQVGFPVVLRVVSRQIIHKSEVNGVALDLQDATAVAWAWERILRGIAGAMPGVSIDGLLVRAMIPPGHEVIIGAKRDPSFGPVLMFGLGGIHVELFRDVSFALAPLDSTTAAELVRRTRAFRLLQGLRGAPAADIPGIEQCLLRLGRLVSDFPRIEELDINPLIATPGPGALAVADVRIRLGPSDQ